MSSVGGALRRWVEGVKVESTVVQRRVALGIFSDAVSMTPVKTGHLRRGWNASMGLPSDDAPPFGATGAPPMPDFSGLKFGDPIFVQNAVEYAIPVILDGHSPKLPAGSFEAMVARHAIAAERG